MVLGYLFVAFCLIMLVSIVIIPITLTFIGDRRANRSINGSKLQADNFVLSRALNQIESDAQLLTGVGDGLALSDTILITINREKKNLHYGIQETITKGRN